MVAIPKKYYPFSKHIYTHSIFHIPYYLTTVECTNFKLLLKTLDL